MRVRLIASLLLIAQVRSGSLLDEGQKPKQSEDCTLIPGKNQECANPEALLDAGKNETNSKDSSSAAICLDDRDECPQYAKRGDCKSNPKFMNAHCKLSYWKQVFLPVSSYGAD